MLIYRNCNLKEKKNTTEMEILLECDCKEAFNEAINIVEVTTVYERKRFFYQLKPSNLNYKAVIYAESIFTDLEQYDRALDKVINRDKFIINILSQKEIERRVNLNHKYITNKQPILINNVKINRIIGRDIQSKIIQQFETDSAKFMLEQKEIDLDFAFAEDNVKTKLEDFIFNQELLLKEIEEATIENNKNENENLLRPIPIIAAKSENLIEIFSNQVQKVIEGSENIDKKKIAYSSKKIDLRGPHPYPAVVRRQYKPSPGKPYGKTVNIKGWLTILKNDWEGWVIFDPEDYAVAARLFLKDDIVFKEGGSYVDSSVPFIPINHHRKPKSQMWPIWFAINELWKR